MRNHATGIDGPEPTVDAEEYLQPKSRAPLPVGISTSGLSDSPPNTPIKPCWPNGMVLAADSPTPQNQQNWDRELQRYGVNRANGSTSHETANSVTSSHYTQPNGLTASTDGSSSRYCSNPLKMVVRGKSISLSCSFVTVPFADFYIDNFLLIFSDCDVTDDCYEGEMKPSHKQAQVGNVMVDLPVDEDDYLVPSPQLAGNTTQYMDIIGDKPMGK